MPLEKSKAFERSVDSMAKIYAVVIGLALSESVKTLVPGPQDQPDLRLATLRAGAPAFIAFAATLIPFWHGMNRHLDRCYLEKDDPTQGAVIFDFVIFFIEAALLLIAGWALRYGLVTFYCLGVVLIVDTIWGFISHQIHFPHQKSHVVRWATINAFFICLAIGVIAYPFNWKPTLLMIIAFARTVADYKFCFEFYFPSAPNASVPSHGG